MSRSFGLGARDFAAGDFAPQCTLSGRSSAWRTRCVSAPSANTCTTKRNQPQMFLGVRPPGRLLALARRVISRPVLDWSQLGVAGVPDSNRPELSSTTFRSRVSPPATRCTEIAANADASTNYSAFNTKKLCQLLAQIPNGLRAGFVGIAQPYANRGYTSARCTAP